jgi:hypothetical protein
MDIYNPVVPAISQLRHDKIPLVIGVSARARKGDPNQGNYIHGAAARRLLRCHCESYIPGMWTEEGLERIRSNHSHLILVVANAIRLGAPAGAIETLLQEQAILAKNIERARLPVVVLSLGAQANLGTLPDSSVAAETLRLLKVISSHCQKIAVRGAFTAEACIKLGVKNVEVVECQSFFWHLTPHFTQRLTDPSPDTAAQAVAFNFTHAAREAALINQAMASGYDFIGQGNIHEQEIHDDELPTTPYRWGVDIALEKGLIDQGPYENWIKTHFFQFDDPSSWIEHMKRYGFSFGTRLHGNMAALIAGTRALWIVHDMRTKEVCEHFRLPFVEFETLGKGAALADLVERADYLDCIRSYPDRFRALYEYLEGAGVPHCLPRPHGTPPSGKNSSAVTGIAYGGTGSASSAIQEAAQTATNTDYDRYPEIFKMASVILRERRRPQRGLRILSFGCASGLEPLALAEKYFASDRDQILGVDVSNTQLSLARAANRYPERVSFELSSPEVLSAYGPFDCIFCNERLMLMAR